MDVDTPSGTNSGAGKKRFEVKKVGSRQRLPQGSEGGAEMAGRPEDELGAGERASSQGVPGTGYHERKPGGGPRADRRDCGPLSGAMLASLRELCGQSQSCLLEYAGSTSVREPST